jgi:hypothetical protein
MLTLATNNWRRIFFAGRPMAVSAAQKTALARVLAGRHRRLCAGELYRIDGWPLPEPTEAITIDSALILIGIFESMSDPDEAQKALRDIVVLFLRSLHLSDDARRSIDPNRLNIRYQLEMLQIWMQRRERSPMFAVLQFAAGLLFRDQVEIDWDSSQTTAQIASALIKDAWALYCKTLNLFGRALDDARVPHSLNGINSTSPKSSMRAA